VLFASWTQLFLGKEGKQRRLLYGCHTANDALLKAQENDGDNLTLRRKVSHWGVSTITFASRKHHLGEFLGKF